MKTYQSENYTRAKDWVGGKRSVFAILGASSHCGKDRAAHDYYATQPEAVVMLCDLESFAPTVGEPACGGGHLSKVLESRGYNVLSTDLVDRGYGKGGVDFLSCAATLAPQTPFDIVTNPPYSFAQEFVERSLELVRPGGKVAMFLKLTFLEGKSRYSLFAANPPRRVYVASSRLTCGKNGTEWEPSAVCYSWMVWEKGYKGEPALRWFNTPDIPSAAVAPTQQQLGL